MTAQNALIITMIFRLLKIVRSISLENAKRIIAQKNVMKIFIPKKFSISFPYPLNGSTK